MIDIDITDCNILTIKINRNTVGEGTGEGPIGLWCHQCVCRGTRAGHSLLGYPGVVIKFLIAPSADVSFATTTVYAPASPVLLLLRRHGCGRGGGERCRSAHLPLFVVPFNG